ncbi:unnamed protein product [Aphanomyces euteiches]
MDFPKCFKHKVDISKVNKEVMNQWITEKITELLGFEDDIVVSTAINLLEPPHHLEALNPKEMQVALTGFLEGDAYAFMDELWTLLLSAQENPTGIPQVFLDKKKKEMEAKREKEKKQQERLAKRVESFQQSKPTIEASQPRAPQNDENSRNREPVNRERRRSPSPQSRRRNSPPARRRSPDRRSRRTPSRERQDYRRQRSSSPSERHRRRNRASSSPKRGISPEDRRPSSKASPVKEAKPTPPRKSRHRSSSPTKESTYKARSTADSPARRDQAASPVPPAKSEVAPRKTVIVPPAPLVERRRRRQHLLALESDPRGLLNEETIRVVVDPTLEIADVDLLLENVVDPARMNDVATSAPSQGISSTYS